MGCWGIRRVPAGCFYNSFYSSPAERGVDTARPADQQGYEPNCYRPHVFSRFYACGPFDKGLRQRSTPFEIQSSQQELLDRSRSSGTAAGIYAKSVLGSTVYVYSSRTLGFYTGAKKILADADHHRDGLVWHVADSGPDLGYSAVHLYTLLGAAS